ncbi:hypothetical protein HDF09_000980 [Edaphobacter lichenicola]|uniref:YggT family protein n=1 Tax=Tunturiibacter empetritectus TaxID=3069691 RepID=A0A7W8MR01_9BACT|nr:hypothetical protein [Edaphobacter lichenicola]
MIFDDVLCFFLRVRLPLLRHRIDSLALDGWEFLILWVWGFLLGVLRKMVF